MYAIDSLRQLAIKYLERAELANFTFQNDILKPFVVIMRNSKSPTIRALIVDCIVQVNTQECMRNSLFISSSLYSVASIFHLLCPFYYLIFYMDILLKAFHEAI